MKRAQLFARENTKRLQIHARRRRHRTADCRPPRRRSRLRLLLSVGVLAALVLAAAAGYLQLTRGRSERVARDAQEQTRDILKTVKEGFFLLDADYRIGSVWSSALTRMFGRKDFSGLSFEELLSESRAAGDPRDGDQVHQAAVGRPRPREPDEEHQPAGPARDSGRERARRPRSALPAVRFPPRHGREGRQARAGVSVSDITSSVLLATELAGLAGERQPAGRHDAGRDAPRSGAAHVVPRCDRCGPAARQLDHARSRRAATPSSARRSTACSASCTRSRARPRRSTC